VVSVFFLDDLSFLVDVRGRETSLSLSGCAKKEQITKEREGGGHYSAHQLGKRTSNRRFWTARRPPSKASLKK
jgi:hypothetical protein